MKINRALICLFASVSFSTTAFAYTSIDVDLAMRDYLNNINSEQSSTSNNNAIQSSASPQTASNIKLVVNGSEIKTDVPPAIIDGRTLVPLRAMLEAVGASINWEPSTQTVTAKKDSTTIKLIIGSSSAYVNNVQKNLDVPAMIINERTMVPARFIAENFNYNVKWNSASNTVNITSYNDVNDHPEIAAHNVSGVPDGWVPCNIGTLNSAAHAIADGSVVYVNGQYWCSPEYANAQTNESVVWVKDVAEGNNSQPIYDTLKPDTVIEYINADWSDISILNKYKSELIYKKLIETQAATAIISDYDVLKYVIPSLPSSFATNPTSGEYEGIRIKVENGKIYICKSDLAAKGII